MANIGPLHSILILKSICQFLHLLRFISKNFIRKLYLQRYLYANVYSNFGHQRKTKCPSRGEWINLCSTSIKWYHSAIKGKEQLHTEQHRWFSNPIYYMKGASLKKLPLYDDSIYMTFWKSQTIATENRPLVSRHWGWRSI